MINTRRAKLALPLPSVQSGLILTAVDPPKGAWKLKTTNYDYHLSHRSGCDWSGLKKWSCCSITNLCGENEGDCDSDAHCLNDLKCGTENCVGPHFNPLADCCFSAVATEPLVVPPQAEVQSKDFEEENKEQRNFNYHPTYAPSYKTKKPYTSYYTKPPTTVEPPSNNDIFYYFFS